MKKLYVIGGLLAVIVLSAASCNMKAETEGNLNTNTQSSEQNTSESSSTPSSSSMGASVNTSVSTSVATPRTVTITHDGSKFSPTSVKIKAGDTVRFVAGSSEVWPASDPHPVHNGLPGFDAKSALTDGGSFSYKFTTKGTFGFHNHLNPSQKGTVIVE